MTNKIYKVKSYQTASLFFHNNKPLPNQCKYYDGVPLRKDKIDSSIALKYDSYDDFYMVMVNRVIAICYYGKDEHYKIVVPKRDRAEVTAEQINLFLPDGIRARYINEAISLVDRVPSFARKRVFPFENQPRTLRYQDGKWCVSAKLRVTEVKVIEVKPRSSKNTEFLIKKILTKKLTPAQERTKARIAVYETLKNEAEIALRLVQLNKKLKRSEREHIDRVLRESLSGYKEPVPKLAPLAREHSEPVPPPLPKASTAPLNKICLMKEYYGKELTPISTHDTRKEALLALREHKSKDPEARYFLIKK